MKSHHRCYHRHHHHQHQTMHTTNKSRVVSNCDSSDKFFLQNHHISPIRNIVRTISGHSYVGILDTYIFPPSRCLSQGISHRVEHTHAQAYEVDTMPCHYHHQQTNITLSPSHSGSSSHTKNSRGDKKMYAIFFYIIIFIYEKKEEM